MPADLGENGAPFRFPDDVRALLAKPNPATITTLRKDGSPVSVATWYLLDSSEEHGDRIHVNMDEGRKRLAHIRGDPRVAMTVLDEANWYTHVSFTGRVVEMADDPDLAGIDRLARHYNGAPYKRRDRRRVDAWIEIERLHGWGRTSVAKGTPAHSPGKS
jgi:PPOX class probable F420-dependent enzyme